MRRAIVENDVIVNIVEAPDGFAVGIECPPGAGIGWVRVDGVWGAAPAPEVPIPSSVTMRQARLALLSAGLLDDVDAAINALPSPQKEAARIEWEYAQEVQRDSGLVSMLAPLLGLTDAQMDALFVQASAL